MITTAKSAVLLVAAISTMAFAALFMGHSTFAASDIPVEIIPRCSSATAGISYYEVDNKNADSVSIAYDNASANATGTFTATPGTSALYVAYNSSDPNNTTSFTYQGVTTQTNANVGTTCDADQLPPVVPTCTDATDASQLNVVWNNDSQIAITTKTGLPVCNTVTLYYSTYRMPDNYNGAGFETNGTVNPTAIPQTEEQSYTFTLEAGTFGTWLENVPAPNYCYNTQADVYYGPEVTGIDANGYGYHADGSSTGGYGHASQYIASMTYATNTTKCAPGMGGGSPTTPTGGSGSGTPSPEANRAGCPADAGFPSTPPSCRVPPAQSQRSGVRVYR